MRPKRASCGQHRRSPEPRHAAPAACMRSQAHSAHKRQHNTAVSEGAHRLHEAARRGRWSRMGRLSWVRAAGTLRPRRRVRNAGLRRRRLRGRSPCGRAPLGRCYTCGGRCGGGGWRVCRETCSAAGSCLTAAAAPWRRRARMQGRLAEHVQQVLLAGQHRRLRRSGSRLQSGGQLRTTRTCCSSPSLGLRMGLASIPSTRTPTVLLRVMLACSARRTAVTGVACSGRSSVGV
jgi:hypothetical protein